MRTFVMKRIIVVFKNLTKDKGEFLKVNFL